MQLLLDSRTDEKVIHDNDGIDLSNMQYEKKLTNTVSR